MIVLFTDFGGSGPYVGQIEAVLARDAPRARVIHLLHDAPAYDAKRYSVKMPDEIPMITQERAYTSPIWYTPAPSPHPAPWRNV